jgi:hypothetical protein
MIVVVVVKVTATVATAIEEAIVTFELRVGHCKQTGTLSVIVAVLRVPVPLAGRV